MHLRAALLIALGFSGCAADPQTNAIANSIFADLMLIEPGTAGRQSSWDRSGANGDLCTVLPGEVLELADIEGTGCVRQLYFTVVGKNSYLRDVVLRMYWDGEESPSVEVPFGDFFGLGHERVRFYRTQMVAVNPGGQGGIDGTYGFNSYWPMPFADGSRLTFTNEGNQVVNVYYHVNYEQLPSLPANTGRFHACWNRENPTGAVGEHPGQPLHDATNLDGAENFTIIDAEGRGNLAGFFLNVDNLGGNWYGEGDDMIFIDGEAWPPAVHGTGSEEVFGGGAYPSVEYTGPYAGYIVNTPAGKVTSYRFYVTDPVRFQKSARLTIEHGHANNMANDYSSTGFWYQLEPHKPFEPLPPAAERRPRPGRDPHDLAFQKHEEHSIRMAQILGLVQILEADQEYGPALRELRQAAAPALEAFWDKDWQVMNATYDRISGPAEELLEELMVRARAAAEQ